jgi:hypothetical protein
MAVHRKKPVGQVCKVLLALKRSSFRCSNLGQIFYTIVYLPPFVNRSEAEADHFIITRAFRFLYSKSSPLPCAGSS